MNKHKKEEEEEGEGEGGGGGGGGGGERHKQYVSETLLRHCFSGALNRPQTSENVMIRILLLFWLVLT